MIPKKIHYCWFGNNPQNYLMRLCIESWKKNMPDFEIKEWNEPNSPMNNAYTERALREGLWSKAANYVRLWALYNEGGIYLDTDIEALKSFTPFLVHNCFAGFQQEEERPGWVNNAILGAEQGNSFIKRCLDRTLQYFEEKDEFIISPVLTTLVLKEMGLNKYGYQTIGNVTIYPTEYFYPYPWYGKFSLDCISENTYCIHHWSASWVQK